MVYGILTNQGCGTPFRIPRKPPTAPGVPLRISKGATLIAFENQPDRLFASQYARVSGKILWYVTKQILHSDDLPATETFGSCREFENWLRRSDNKLETRVGDNPVT